MKTLKNLELLTKNYQLFNESCLRKILENIEEKGFSWRNTPLPILYNTIKEYIDTNNFQAISNLAFMLWEKFNEKELLEEL